jgi:hypothetical protein
MALLPRSPGEFYDRVSALVATRGPHLRGKQERYRVTPLDQAVEELSHVLGQKVLEATHEPGLLDIEAQVGRRIEALRTVAPFALMHNADYALARTAYVVCRALRPTTVLETGVAYGVTSAFILQALELNGGGVLHSVDLPPLHPRSDEFVGSAIPEELTSRWRLHRGSAQRVLPALLPHLEGLGVFIHDSLHTFQNMQAELQLVTPRLKRPAVVLADDIQDNRAYAQWVDQVSPTYTAAVGEMVKPALFGVAVLCEGSAPRAASPASQG